MDKETETTINRLLADNKAAHDLNDYLTKENKRLREALKEIARDWLIKHHVMLVNKARAALREGE